MIQKYSEVKTLNTINRLLKDFLGKGNYKNPGMINNILMGIPINSLILNKDESDKIEILSSKDDILSIISFINDEFALEEGEFKGLKFSELPEDIRFYLLEQHIYTVVYYRINNEMKEFITDYYNRKPLNKVEEISEVDKYLNKYLQNKFFDVVNINPLDNSIIAQIFMIQTLGAIELSSKKINKFKEDIENNTKEMDKQNLEKVLNYLSSSYKEKTNYLKKAHLPIICLCAKIAIENNIKANKFKNIMDLFFENLDKHLKYKEAGNSHTTSKRNVEIRINELTNYLKKNIKQ